MKRVVILLFAVLCSASLYAQTNRGASDSSHRLMPEFTARAKMGLYQNGYDFTGGLRLNRNWTAGILGGYSTTYIDAAPGNIYAVNTAAFVRRYIHIGRKDIFALYGDFSAGASWIYKVTGKYQTRGDLGQVEAISESKGDVEALYTFEPGVRIRFYKNIHLFVGPTFSSHCLGLHAGIGF